LRLPSRDKLSLVSWLFYDFANSSYSAVIAAVVFPVYLVQRLAPSPQTGDLWWARAVSISMLLVAITAPFVGGIADLSGYRKRFLVIYSLFAILATASLSLSRDYGFFWAVGLFCVANFFVEGAIVFYNAFLPEVADKNHLGRVSGWGFGLGYLGSAISLFVAVVFVKKAQYALAFLSVALFFLVFSLPAFFFLKETSGVMSLKEAALTGWKKTLLALKRALSHKDFRLFVLSYFFFRDGINTIIAFSSIFAANTLGFSQTNLLWLYLLVQLSAMTGAMLFSLPTDYWGPKSVLLLCLSAWTGLCGWAYFVSAFGFWFLASLGGVFLGSTQAAARAMFSRFIPKGLEAEFFGLYGFVGKTSSVLGPLVFGTTVSLTGSERLAALSVAVLFVLGILLLLPVKE